MIMFIVGSIGVLALTFVALVLNAAQSIEPPPIVVIPQPPAVPKQIDLATCNCVMFRLDDVQDYFEYDEEIGIMEIFREENASLTIGIVGNNFGADVKIVNYVKSNMGHLTIANHGWDHEDFADIPTREAQAELLQKTNDRLSDQLHIQPTIFITPYNSFNSNTTLAMRDTNMTVISADIDADPNFIAMTDFQMLHLPQTTGASLYDEATGNWTAIPTEQVLFEIASDIEDFGFSVVTMHPADYHLIDIETMLDALALEGTPIVSMADIKVD